MQIDKTRQLYMLAFFLFVQPLVAQVSEPKRQTYDPAVIVREFCQLDLEGVRLDSTNPRWNEFSRFMIGNEEWPDTPIVAVSAFHVATVRQEQRKAIVRVSYDRVGRIEGGSEPDEVVVETKSETFEFHLVKTNAGWKIPFQNLVPHVSVRAMRAHLMKLLDMDAKNGVVGRKVVLAHLISQLDVLTQGTSR
jgi:hypothetical protein